MQRLGIFVDPLRGDGEVREGFQTFLFLFYFIFFYVNASHAVQKHLFDVCLKITAALPFQYHGQGGIRRLK